MNPKASLHRRHETMMPHKSKTVFDKKNSCGFLFAKLC